MHIIKNFIFTTIFILLNFQNSLYAMEEDNLAVEKREKDFAEKSLERAWWLDEDLEEQLKQVERTKILKLQDGEIEESRHSIKSVKKKLKILENIGTRIYSNSLQKRVGQLIRELQYGNRCELIDQQDRLHQKEQLLIELQKKQAKLQQKLAQKIEVKDLESLNLQELEQLYKKLDDQFEGKNYKNISYTDNPMVYYNQSEIPDNSIEANSTQEAIATPDNLIDTDQISTPENTVNKTSINVIKVIREKLLNLGASLKNWRNVIMGSLYKQQASKIHSKENDISKYPNDPNETSKLDAKIFFSGTDNVEQARQKFKNLITFKKYFLKSTQSLFAKKLNREE